MIQLLRYIVYTCTCTCTCTMYMQVYTVRERYKSTCTVCTGVYCFVTVFGEMQTGWKLFHDAYCTCMYMYMYVHVYRCMYCTCTLYMYNNAFSPHISPLPLLLPLRCLPPSGPRLDPARFGRLTNHHVPSQTWKKVQRLHTPEKAGNRERGI